MANSFQVQTTLLKQTVARLFQTAVYMPRTNRNFEQALKNNGIVDQGMRVTFRLPNHVKVLSDIDVAAGSQDFTERLEDVAIEYKANSRQDFTSDELQFYTKHDFERRFVEPVSGDIGVEIDAALAKALFRDSWFHIGTAGSPPNSWEAIGDVMAFMNRLAIPRGSRSLVLDERTRIQLLKYTNFQNSFEVARTKLINKAAMMGQTCLFDLYSSPLAYEHVAGKGDSTATPGAVETGYVVAGVVSAVPATGSDQLVIKNLATTDTDVFRVGDKIKIDGRNIYSYGNHKTLSDTAVQLTIMADSTGTNPRYDSANEWYTTASGVTTVTVNPPFNPYNATSTGEYANMDTQPQVDDPIYLVTANTLLGSTNKVPYKCNMAFIPDGLLFAAPQMVALGGGADSTPVFVRDEGMNFGMMHYMQSNIIGEAGKGLPYVTHRYRTQYGYKVLGDYVVTLIG